MAGEEARARRYLLAGTLVLVAVRGLLALPRLGPLHVSDEIGYLTNARVLSGGTPAELLTTAVYRGGYSLVLAPLTVLSHDPVVVYRLALLVNVLLAATLPALLYLLLTRCFRLSPLAAVVPALAASCYPSLTQATGAAMSENLLVPLIVAWLLCLGLMLDTRRGVAQAGWAAALGLCAALLWTTHGRMVVVVAVTAVAVVALALVRRLPARAVVWCLVPMACGLWAGHLLTEHLITENYGGRHVDEAGTRLSALDDLDGVLSVGRNLAGQVWYLVVATLGVTVMLLVADGRRLTLALRRREITPPDAVLAVLLLTTMGLLVVSALSFAEPTRPDQMVYGRYVEVVAPGLVAIGLARLPAAWSTSRLLAAMSFVLVLTLAVAVLRHGLDVTEAGNQVNVASLPFHARALGPPAIVAAGIVAAACMAALVVLARRRAWAVAPLLVLFFLPATALSERALVRSTHSEYPEGWSGPGPALEGSRVPAVGYDVDRDREEFYGGLKYPWFLTDSAVVHFSSRLRPPPSRYVISSDGWPAEHPDQPAKALWRDSARDQTLWKLEDDPLAPLRRLEACLGAGSPAQATLFGTERAAIEHVRNIRRFLRAAGRDESTIVRGGRIAVGFSSPPDASARAALRLCL